MRFKVLCSAACIVGLLGCSSEKKLSVEKAESFPNGAKKKENYFYQDGLKKDIVRTVYYFQNGAVQSDAYFKAGKARQHCDHLLSKRKKI